jgi:hypothetical protein
MSPPEVGLLTQCLVGVRRYFEFGVGGSTIFVWNHCIESGIRPEIYGIDTSREWIDSVRTTLNQPETVHIEHLDLGPLESWGYPVDKTPKQPLWMLYPQAIHRCPNPSDFDLVLIDGRFRVACLIQTILACGPSTKILIHDYMDRPEYHVVESWVSRVSSMDTLALFRKRDLSPRQHHKLEKAFLKYWKVLR